jgi:hypothetical protein
VICGASLENTDKFGSTTISSAAEKEHAEFITEELNCGARLDSTDESDSTPLRSTGTKGHVEVYKELLKLGAMMEGTDGYDTATLGAEAANMHSGTESGIKGQVPPLKKETYSYQVSFVNMCCVETCTV